MLTMARRGSLKFNMRRLDIPYCKSSNCLTAPGTGVSSPTIPRSRGGAHTWDNVVAACRRCNSRKENRTVSEAGLKLRHRPAAPKDVFRLSIGRVEPEWEPFL